LLLGALVLRVVVFFFAVVCMLEYFPPHGLSLSTPGSFLFNPAKLNRFKIIKIP